MSKFIPLILFTVFSNFLSQIMLKKGMTQIKLDTLNVSAVVPLISQVLTNYFVVGGLLVMVISMGAHLVVLSKVDISYAYPFLGLSFVLITIWGYAVLKEPINIYKIAGVASIVVGVVLVARS